MTFLAIIIAVLLLQAWGSGAPVQRDDWFFGWKSRVARWQFADGIKLALLILLPVLLAHYILDGIRPILFGLGWLALAVIMLLYSFGRGDFQALMARYRGQVVSGDFEGAYLVARSQSRLEGMVDDPGSAQEAHALIQKALLYEGYQRWFAVLFYFVLLGPAGALAYRLLQLCLPDFSPQLVRRCLFLVDWVPVRLLAAAFCLTGHFVSTRDSLFAALGNSSAGAGELLYQVGLAAVDEVPLDPQAGAEELGQRAAGQNRELAGLLSRSAVGWVLVLSLLVLLD